MIWHLNHDPTIDAIFSLIRSHLEKYDKDVRNE